MAWLYVQVMMYIVLLSRMCSKNGMLPNVVAYGSSIRAYEAMHSSDRSLNRISTADVVILRLDPIAVAYWMLRRQ